METMTRMKARWISGIPAAALVAAAILALAGPGTARSGEAAAGPAPADVQAVVEGSNAFAMELYAKLAADPMNEGKNLFFSPYSLSTALAMTSAGARGNTGTEMATVMHYLPQERLHPACGKLVADIDTGGAKGGYEISVANRLWGQKGYRFLDPFLNLVRAHYGTGLEPVDFIGDTEGARKTINAWVEKKTQKKIRELLAPGILTGLTRLVLTNAIYFKGDWAAQFDVKATRDEEFRVSAAQKVRVKMMNRTGKYALLEQKDFQALALPYAGDALSLIVLLPRATDGLSALEASLTPDALAAHLAELAPIIRAGGTPKVVVGLPKFQATSAFSLKDVLVALGMRDAFDKDKADFSGMNGAGPTDREALHITAVVHKAYVKVNEEGTEAAAATAVVMAKRSARIGPVPSFRADHPFLFLIRDNRTGMVLFLGRVTDPTQGGEGS